MERNSEMFRGVIQEDPTNPGKLYCVLFREVPVSATHKDWQPLGAIPVEDFNEDRLKVLQPTLTPRERRAIREQVRAAQQAAKDFLAGKYIQGPGKMSSVLLEQDEYAQMRAIAAADPEQLYLETLDQRTMALPTQLITASGKTIEMPFGNVVTLAQFVHNQIQKFGEFKVEQAVAEHEKGIEVVMDDPPDPSS